MVDEMSEEDEGAGEGIASAQGHGPGTPPIEVKVGKGGAAVTWTESTRVVDPRSRNGWQKPAALMNPTPRSRLAIFLELMPKEFLQGRVRILHRSTIYIYQLAKFNRLGCTTGCGVDKHGLAQAKASRDLAARAVHLLWHLHREGQPFQRFYLRGDVEEGHQRSEQFHHLS
jgi:hypothetical protein